MTETTVTTTIHEQGDRVRQNSRLGGMKFRGVSEIGTGGVIRLRQIYLGPHVD